MASKQGKLLIGTDAGVDIIALDAPQERHKNCLIRGYGVNAILPNAQAGNDWYGTEAHYFSNGAIYWHHQKDKKQGWLNKTNWAGKKNDSVSTLARDGANIYIGFQKGGMVRVGGTWKRFMKQNDNSMPGNDIRSIVIGKKDRFIDENKHQFYRSSVWVATSTGLGRFIPKKAMQNDGAWESAPFKAAAVKAQGGLITDDITALAYDKITDTLWIGTNKGGLTRLRVGIL